MQETILQLGPDDAGVKLTHEEFANADCQPPFRYERVLPATGDYSTPLLPGLVIPLAECFGQP